MMILPVGLSGLLAACEPQEPAQAPVIVQTSHESPVPGDKVANLTCPVHAEAELPAEIDPAHLTRHRGVLLGVCAEGCLEDWAEWSDARKDGFLDLIAGAEPR